MYRSVGWESPCIEQIETALNNSYAKFVAYDGDKPVGMVRIIGDGGMSFYIKDYAVIPEYQSKGLGKALMQFLEDYIRNSMPKDWAVSLELISSKEAVAFYEKFGFEQRPCDWDGSGMFKMLR
ncbi:MAG TPA: GNAT family N-acetyltransferase [Ruminococcus sp.]|uniref:GNAT family N-acetyltransferase n=1 Tax=Ruminococcus bromii TaxID=40518 RepID=UPI000E9188FB|nr:GNAT family N-acetyltransferase [Ruminococcus sp.]HBA00635.1 GNAT family N-acetyltransferase [Ruminococcus sp.]